MKTDPLREEGSDGARGRAARFPAGGRLVGRGADAGRRGDDAEAAGARLGDEADRRRARLQPEHGKTLVGAGRLAALRPAAAWASARRAQGVARGALPPPRRQRRRRAPGAGRRARGHGVAAHGGAGGGAVPPGSGGTRTGHGALRDAAGPPAPDRLRRAAGRDRRRVDASASLRRDARLLTPTLRASVPTRTPVLLARR